MRPLLDANEAAELLGVPASWVRREAREGRIPVVRLSRYVRFDPDALEAWVRDRAQQPSGEAKPPASDLRRAA